MECGLQNPRTSKLIARLAVLAVLMGILLHFATRGLPKSAVRGVVAEPASSKTPRAVAHRHRETEAAPFVPETQEVAMVDFDWRTVLTNQTVPPKLPREEVE